MAKLGEGDPRWLVQDRADGKNVNNWHWSEKDCIEWCRQKLNSLFSDFVVLENVDGITIKTTGIESCKGDAFINIRKNKFIASYELDIRILWEGKSVSQEGNLSGEASGRIHLPYVADENHDEDPEMKVICEASDNVAQQLKTALFSKGKKAILARVSEFVAALRAGGPAVDPDAQQAAAHEQNGTGTSSESAPAAAEQKLPAAAAPAAPAPSKPLAEGSKKSLKMKEKFYCSARDLYECFTVEGRVRAFTQSVATVEAQPGGKFSWYGGSVQGEFEELVPASRLVMKWRFSTWADDCFSKVTVAFSEPDGPGNAVLSLVQEGIPDADKFGNEDVFDTVQRGWKGQIFSRIRQVFGYGV